MRNLRLALPLVLLLAGGCASVAPFRGLPLGDPAVYVSGVTPIRQDASYACGAACVAAVAAHWGVDLAEFVSAHPRQADDATAADLQALAEKLGLQAFAYQGSMDDLEDNLRKGRPLIVMIPVPLTASVGPVAGLLLNAWNRFGSRPAHWVVVVGFAEKQMILHDPASGPLRVRRGTFAEWWAQEGNRCVLIAAADGGRKPAIE